MKSQLTALFVAMPLLFIAVQSHAEYVFKFPIEESSGGTLPNGSIVIVKNAAGVVVTPPVVDEPDPLEPEDRKCDPYLNEGRNANVGKQRDYWVDFWQSPTQLYSACKLKTDNNPSLILKLVNGSSVEFGDKKRSNFCTSLTQSSKSCTFQSSLFTYVFDVKVLNGSYNLSTAYVDVSNLTYRMKDTGINLSEIKKVVINNKECSDFRVNRSWQTLKNYTCLYDFTLESLAAGAGKPYLIEFYR